VEKQLAEEGLNRHSLGRESSSNEFGDGRSSPGDDHKPIKEARASCDWSRERFTMDEGLSEAVREVFIRLYYEGLIYRSDYSSTGSRCQTALADLEVEHHEILGETLSPEIPR